MRSGGVLGAEGADCRLQQLMGVGGGVDALRVEMEQVLWLPGARIPVLVAGCGWVCWSAASPPGTTGPSPTPANSRPITAAVSRVPNSRPPARSPPAWSLPRQVCETLARAKMDLTKKSPCADMDRNLQRDMDYKAKMEDIRREGRMMEDRAMLVGRKADLEEYHILSSNQSDVSRSQSPWVIVMEFRVFKDRKLSHVPNGNNNIPGEMTIVEPGKVDWSTMASHLRHQGYKSNADVYYIKPGCTPPQGMIMISGEDDVHQMLQALQGMKKCDLYIVRNCLYSDSDDSEYGMSEEEECPYPYLDIGDRGQDEDDTSPSTLQSTLDNIKKELSFDKDDEQKRA